VKEKVKEKQKAYVALSNNTSDEEKEVKEAKYKLGAKKLVKKAATIAKNIAYERLYQKLKIKEGEKNVFKLARASEKKIRDLGNIRCIKSDDGKVLVQETKIKAKWHFSELFNGKRGEYSLLVSRED